MSRPVFNFNAFVEKEKLKEDGSNFDDWHRTLKYLLRPVQREYVLDATLGDPPAATASDADKAVYQTRKEDHVIVQSGILTRLPSELQKRFENSGAYEIVEDLKIIFQAHARTERYEGSEKFLTVRWRREVLLLNTC